MDFVVTILYLWLTLFLQCGAPMEHRISKRLVGSNVVWSINEFPYIAYIERPNSSPNFCAGAIIAEHWVLSVANCLLQNVSKFAKSFHSPVEPKLVVKVGNVYQHRGSSHPVDKVIIHPKFQRTRTHLKNNIAVLHVTKSFFRYNRKVKAIALGQIPDKSGIWVQTAGWGYPKDPNSYYSSSFYAKRLRKLSLQTMDNRHCRRIHKKVGNVVRPTEMCAFGGLGQATCEGDEGNPLVTMDNNLLVGIHSGYQTCKGDFPGLFTRISYFIYWLRSVTGLRLPLH